MEVIEIFRGFDWAAVLFICTVVATLMVLYLYGTGLVETTPDTKSAPTESEIPIRLLFCRVDAGFARAFFHSVMFHAGNQYQLSRMVGEYVVGTDGVTRVFKEGYLFEAARKGVPLVVLGAESLPQEMLSLFGKIQRTGCVRVKGMPEGSGLIPTPGFQIVLVCERESYNEALAREIPARFGFSASVAVFDTVRRAAVAA